MPIDAYSPCPGGTGKKIKFCCKDLLGDLQKIERMLEGEQHMACLSYIERLEQANPDRACLLATKALLLRIMGRFEDAKSVSATFLEKHPENPLALADAALVLATEGRGTEAIPKLEQAFVASKGQLSGRLYETIGLVARVLVAEGHFLAARALTLFQASLVGHDDPSMELLMRLNGMQNVPLVVKDGRGLQRCPDDAPWKAEFDEAFRLASEARWSEAEGKLSQLSEVASRSPALWRNLAMLRSWLADNRGAIDALRHYAALEIPLEDAVEAEALALFLSEDTLGDELDVFDVTYPIENFEGLQEMLGSSSRVAQTPVDPRMFADPEAGPPPKSVYLFFDKPAPAADAPLDLETVPRVICHSFLFGKETDRQARLECFGLVDRDRGLIAAAINEFTGGSEGEVEESGRISRTRDMLSREWRLPDGSSREEFQKLADAYLEESLLRRWPDMELGLFQGKTPREVAVDAGSRNRLLAAIMVIDFWLEQSGARFDTNRLRSELDLPTLETIDASAMPITNLPLVRLARVDVGKISDEDVLAGYRRAVAFGAQTAVERFARELVSRESLAGREERLQAYRLLSRMTDDPEEALAMVEKGRKATLDAGGSCANWDLLELTFRFERMEGHEANRLIGHLQTQHMREPGVMEALTGMLVQLGVLRPDGTFAGPPPAAAEEPPIVMPGGAPAGSGGLWTPDNVSGGSGEKPKIWTPGMD